MDRFWLMAVGFLVGAVAMALGGITELSFGVPAEQQSQERIPLPRDPVGARNSATLRDLHIFVDHSADPVARMTLMSAVSG
jgi:hypothetical protein